MSIEKYKILIVDDDPVLLELHSAYLERMENTVVSAMNGKEALDKIKEFPDAIGLIVSDILMPEMDGYEFCKELKSDAANANIPVIFVSAHTDLEEKLKGYDVGADDYIHKPIDGIELVEKSKNLIEKYDKYLTLNEAIGETQKMAMSTLSFSSELGGVINFYKEIFDAKSYEDVSEKVVAFLDSHGLAFNLQIYSKNNVITINGSGEDKPLETQVIEMARDQGRFYDFGARTIMNFSTFSLLVKNMPVDDDERYGRTKDLLGMLGNGLEAKIQQLNNDLVMQNKEKVLYSINESISAITKLYSDVQKENIAAIEDLNDDVNQKIMVMGLMEYQEQEFQDIVDKCLERSNASFYKGLDIQAELKNINAKLSTLFDE